MSTFVRMSTFAKAPRSLGQANAAQTRSRTSAFADRWHVRGRRALLRRRALPRLLGAIAALGSAAAADAASLAGVSTGAAHQVSYDSAVLTGAVNPRGSDTSYYFQYGPTTALGGQTAIADAGSGTGAVEVSLPVTGLQPLTVYHFRLVAVNGAGAASGGDRTLLTTKVPLSVQIGSSPNPVPYGATIVIQGMLTGTENGDREVELLADSFPFTAGFQAVENPQLTNATGGFSFPLPALTESTRFEVMAVTNPPVVSPVAVENVAVQVVSHVARARRPHHVRVYGTVTPAENGMQVGVLREVHGHGVLMGGTGLVARNATSSKFSVVVPAKPGVYRVLVRVTSGAQVSSYGPPMKVG
jgi:hypothetical protein